MQLWFFALFSATSTPFSMHRDARFLSLIIPAFFKFARSAPAEGKRQSFNGALKEAVNNQSPLAVPSAARLVTPVLWKSWKRSRMENGWGVKVPTTLKDINHKVEKCPLKAWSDTLFRRKRCLKTTTPRAFHWCRSRVVILFTDRNTKGWRDNSCQRSLPGQPFF